MNSTVDTIGTAVAIALLGPNDQASAQARPAGRASKRSSSPASAPPCSSRSSRSATPTRRVEVITAEDIGKMPDKNVADSLPRVPGVTISSASANEGGVRRERPRQHARHQPQPDPDPDQRPQHRAPATGSCSTRSGTVGRSVSYSLLPSELVDKVVVRKSVRGQAGRRRRAGSGRHHHPQSAQLRRPASAIFGSVGAVYADLPDKTDPQISVLGNWKNDDGTFGVTVQAFSEKRHLRRDGQELLGYEQIARRQPRSRTSQSRPGRRVLPDADRLGAVRAGAQAHRRHDRRCSSSPTDDLELEANVLPLRHGGDQLQPQLHAVGQPHHPAAAQRPGARCRATSSRNNTLVAANFAARRRGADPSNAVTASTTRSRARAPSPSTEFFSVDGKWDVSDRLTLPAQVGTSEGHGETPTQDVSEMRTSASTPARAGSCNGVGAPPTGTSASGNTDAVPAARRSHFDWIFGAQDIDVEDKEDWAQIDGRLRLDGGALDRSEVRRALQRAQARTLAGQRRARTSARPIPFDPANCAAGLPELSGRFRRRPRRQTSRATSGTARPAQLAEFNGDATPTATRSRASTAAALLWPGREQRGRLRAGELRRRSWSGNIGVRYVRTKESTTCHQLRQTADPNAGRDHDSLFGPYKSAYTSRTRTTTGCRAPT